ncbi:MAG: hypothetical protein F6K55_48465 [Moorea sp. SIO4A3]|nr:hypothetical protein [Moorena sp. SIO4A3]
MKKLKNLTNELYLYTGNREQGTGSRESGVGNRESGIGNRESGVGSRESGKAGNGKNYNENYCVF